MLGNCKYSCPLLARTFSPQPLHCHMFSASRTSGCRWVRIRSFNSQWVEASESGISSEKLRKVEAVRLTWAQEEQVSTSA